MSIFRYHGDPLDGYYVSTHSGRHLGRVERSDPSGAAHTRPRGWVTIINGRRLETLSKTRQEASELLLRLQRSH